MQIVYGEIKDEVVERRIHKLVNQIYRLLPMREEGGEWQKPLDTIVEELCGMNYILIDEQDILFPLVCKLKGLTDLTQENEFMLYRRTIFDCLGLAHELIERCQKCQD